jgi:hypothetical protein
MGGELSFAVHWPIVTHVAPLAQHIVMAAISEAG